MAGIFVGRTAIITGAGRGIGRETALLFAREGANVVVNDLGGGPQGDGGNTSVAQSVVDEIKAMDGDAVAETSSIATMEGGKAVVDCAMDTFGRVDFLINNAGIIRPKRVWDMDERDFELVLAVNLKSCFYTLKHAAPRLMKQGGAVVNLSSPSGLGHLGMSNYAAAKEGVIGFTRSVARELGEHGVRCNALRPIAGQSAMQIPEVYETITYTMEKLGIPFISNQYLDSGGIEGLPAHVAAAVAWLCSPESEPLNGRDLYINGGQIALVQEPELIRSRFNPDGWSLTALRDPAVSSALTFDQRNRYSGQ